LELNFEFALATHKSNTDSRETRIPCFKCCCDFSISLDTFLLHVSCKYYMEKHK